MALTITIKQSTLKELDNHHPYLSWTHPTLFDHKYLIIIRNINPVNTKGNLWSISSTFYAKISCTNVIRAAVFLRMYIKKAAEMTFVRNICTFNVDEMDTCEKWFCVPSTTKVLNRF